MANNTDVTKEVEKVEPKETKPKTTTKAETAAKVGH
jgi:hypothetical protein